MISDYVSLAYKNLKRRGLRSYLTLLGIFIGIAVVVALISLGDGLREAVNAQFGVSSTQVLTVQAGGLSGYGPPGSGVVTPLTLNDADAIEKINNVELSIPRNIEYLKADFNDKQVISFAGSLPKGKSRPAIFETLDLTIDFGRELRDDDVDKIILGNDFTDKDKNRFGKAIQVGDSLTLNGKDFRVIGIMEKKGSFIMDKVILIDDDELRGITNNDDHVDLIAVKATSKDAMPQIKADIEKLLRDRRNVKKGEEDFSVSTPQAVLATVNQILLGVQIFIVIIALISIIVGAIGIVNTMTTSVLERRKEIGIMKAIGAKNSDIFYQFFIESGMLGLVGGISGVLIGAGAGYVGTLEINSFIGSTMRPDLNFTLIILTLIGSFIIGAVAGIAPAMKAARQNPVDALRG
jgi:putative ABC transport system permease protein